VKVTNGQGGYETGALVEDRKKSLSKQQTTWFVDRVKEIGYWKLPTREMRDSFGLDGAQWILEATRNGRYKIVERWSPKEGPIRILGLIMLIDLAELKLLFQDVY